MDYSDLEAQVDNLDLCIEDLEEKLEPFLNAPLSETASKLPVLDQAKFYVMATYAIESLVFCSLFYFVLSFTVHLHTYSASLRLSDVNAKEHPIMNELKRVKQYFDKIKVAEHGEEKRENMSLNKDAARRVIKHALVRPTICGGQVTQD